MMASLQTIAQLRRKFAGLSTAILLVLIVVANARAQQARSYPPFTLTTLVTAYDAKGFAIANSTTTQYHSTNGDWRFVWSEGGYETATVYRRQLGVYFSSSRTETTVRVANLAGGCPIRTAEQLRMDPKFSRTEEVLGLQTYVLTERLRVASYVMDTYYAPELGGGTPFKRIYNYDDGRKVVEEPIVVIHGEPALADVRGPQYPVVEQVPVGNGDLAGQVLAGVDPVFPYDADTGGFGKNVYVSVIINESGRVLSARTNTSIMFLRDPAVEAAYRTTFSPTYRNGRAVLSQGFLRYQYTPAQLARK